MPAAQADELLDVLRGAAPARSPGCMAHTRVAAFRAQLAALTPDAETSAAILRGAFDRIVHAPAFRAIAEHANPTGNTREQLAGWLWAERVVQGVADKSRDHGWTAACDIEIKAGRISYEAPRIGGLVVDLASPLAHSVPFLPPALRKGAMVPPQLALVLDKLKQAYRTIEAAGHGYTELVEASLVCIACPDIRGSENGLWSASSRELPGVCFVVNVSSPHLTSVRLTDSIVHEAVHALLYDLEKTSPLLTAAGLEPGTTIRSPWTGRELPVHGFVHACFVWFTLLAFWTRLLSGSLIGTSDAQPFRQRARRGFVRQRADCLLDLIGEYITPEAATHIARIWSLAPAYF